MPELLKTLLGGAGGAALVTGAFALIQWWLNRKAAKADKAAACGAAMCTTHDNQIVDLTSKVDNVTMAMQTILYDRIKHLAKSYIKRGWISVEEYEDLKRMHSVYHNELCGNGFLDGIMDEIEHLEKRVL